MARLIRSLLAVILVGSIAGLAGFVAFAESVRELAPSPRASADAIVVLTGDEARISTGMQLMEAGRARRLLISGVHPNTRVPTELKRHIRGSEPLVRCCVDIGRAALNTSGNADEARQWSEEHGFGSLIVVTSSYHMRRSLAEFQRVMPAMRLIGYPVASGRHLRFDSWWSHAPTLRLLAGEYVKFLGSAARLGLSRLLLESRSPSPDRPEPPLGDEHRTVGAIR